MGRGKWGGVMTENKSHRRGLMRGTSSEGLPWRGVTEVGCNYRGKKEKNFGIFVTNGHSV